MTATFLALGDSYTIGEGVAPRDRWPSQIVAEGRRKGLEVAEPRIIARTGWTTDELSSAIDAQNPQGTFDLVTLLIGVNDQYSDRDPETYRAGFATLLRRAIGLAGGDARRLIVVSIPDWGVTPFAEGRDRARIAAGIDTFNAINREEAKKANARYVDVTPISRAGAALVVADRLHPSAEMYTKLTAAILPHALVVLSGQGRRTDLS